MIEELIAERRTYVSKTINKYNKLCSGFSNFSISFDRIHLIFIISYYEIFLKLLQVLLHDRVFFTSNSVRIVVVHNKNTKSSISI